MSQYKPIPFNKPIRMAFLGCGNITKKHSNTLKRLDNSVQRFYASRSLEKANQFNAKLRGEGFFGNYQSAIESPDIDVIFIATPPAAHLDLTLNALAAGKHVIVEKPPFFHAADFDIVRDASEAAQCQVMIAENYFYKPLLVKLRSVLSQNLIGDVLFIYINALKKQKVADWRADESIGGGGALFEGGIHWVNFLSNLGLTVDKVVGFQPQPKAEIEKSMQVTFQYQEGALAILLYSWEVPTLFQGLRISRIFGREGSITFESNGIFMFIRGRKIRLTFPKFSDISGYKAMFHDFFKALRAGEAPQFTFRLAQRDLQFIENAYETSGK